MSDLAVTLTIPQLRQLIREEVGVVLAATTPKSAPPLAFLTVEEMAACLKIPAPMVRKRARQGELKCFYIGTSLRFDAAELVAFKEANRAPRGRK